MNEDIWERIPSKFYKVPLERFDHEESYFPPVKNIQESIIEFELKNEWEIERFKIIEITVNSVYLAIADTDR